MAEYHYGVSKVYGSTATGVANMSSAFEFITITTVVDIRPNTVAGGGNATSQAALDKLIEIVSERAQPVVMGSVTGGGPYVIKMAVEHPWAWQSVDAATPIKLAARIVADGINHGFGGTTPTVTFGDYLA